MDDRELLELAAKAIGYEFQFNLANAGQLFKDGDYVKFWNPLTDDGDAFRLACKLSMDIFIHQISVAVAYGDLVYRLPCEKDNRTEVARKAIVMAAAEIGRAM